MDFSEAFKIIFLLKKQYRNTLALIRKESDLILFLKKISVKISENNIKTFKAVIPAIFKLQDFLNQIDSELNVKDILLENKGTYLKKFRNVPNFSRTMSVFDSADAYITFVSGIDKVVALRYNENWNSPKKDTPIITNQGKILNTFDKLQEDWNDYIKTEIQKILKQDVEITAELISKNLPKIKMDKFEAKFDYNNAIEIFEYYYRFNPERSNNNGLYTLILEVNEKNFGGQLRPVHEIKNIESDLVKAGISKKNKKPKLFINFEKIKGTTLYCSLYCEKTKLKDFKIINNISTLKLQN